MARDQSYRASGSRDLSELVASFQCDGEMRADVATPSLLSASGSVSLCRQRSSSTRVNRSTPNYKAQVQRMRVPFSAGHRLGRGVSLSVNLGASKSTRQDLDGRRAWLCRSSNHATRT